MANLRASANGVMKYDEFGAHEIKINYGAGMHGRREVLNNMGGALRFGRRPVYDGRGKGHGRGCARHSAIGDGAARNHAASQVRYPRNPRPEDDIGEGGDTIISARIVDEHD